MRAFPWIARSVPRSVSFWRLGDLDRVRVKRDGKSEFRCREPVPALVGRNRQCVGRTPHGVWQIPVRSQYPERRGRWIGDSIDRHLLTGAQLELIALDHI